MPNLTEAFERQAVRVGAVVHRVPGGQLAGRVAEILRDEGCRTCALASKLPERDALAGALAKRGVSELPSDVLRPTERTDAGVSWARLGVAESGSVLLHSSSEDRRVELCVDLHLVVVDETSLVATLDEAFAVLREIAAQPPAYATLVSGPSRSADIERTLTIGVHGPRALHILLQAGL